MSGEKWVGIDVCQKYLDVYVRPLGELFQVTNDQEGISQLVQSLRKIKPELTAIEATGQLAIADIDLSASDCVHHLSAIALFQNHT